MPRPRAPANASRATKVTSISAVNPPDGVFTQAAALSHPLLRSPRRECSGALSTAEIFLIRRVVFDQHAAINSQRHTGDHACPVTGKKQNRVGDILGLAHAPERDLLRP